MKEDLLNLVKFGAETGIPNLQDESKARPTQTALDNEAAVWKHLIKFALNGWVRPYPPSTHSEVLTASEDSFLPNLAFSTSVFSLR